MKKHLDRGCLAADGQSVEMPGAGHVIEFNNHERNFKTPYIIYGDFECLTTQTGCYSKPIDPHETKTAFTRTYQKHVPTG